MNKESENIEFWIGRIIIMFFFFFLISFSNIDSTTQIDNCISSIEQVADIHNSVILIEPVGIPNYDISLLDCELCLIKISDINFDRWISNNTINHQFKCEEFNYFNIKSKLLRLCLPSLKIFSDEDYLLIS